MAGRLETEDKLDKYAILQSALAIRYICPLCQRQKNRRKQTNIRQGGLVHYNRRGKLIGKMVRSFFCEPNHYDLQGRGIGYSRKIGFAKVAHFDRNGLVVGYTYRIFGLFFITALKTQNIFIMRR